MMAGRNLIACLSILLNDCSRACFLAPRRLLLFRTITLAVPDLPGVASCLGTLELMSLIVRSKDTVSIPYDLVNTSPG